MSALRESYPGHPAVRGRCPACNWESLFLGKGGYVTCANLDCPNPIAVSELLEAIMKAQAREARQGE
jgi:hypothetical protein